MNSQRLTRFLESFYLNIRILEFNRRVLDVLSVLLKILTRLLLRIKDIDVPVLKTFDLGSSAKRSLN